MINSIPEQVTYDAEDLASVLQLSVRTIRRLDATGVLPDALRLGKPKRWLSSTILEWMKAGCPPRNRRRTVQKGRKAGAA